MPYYRIYTVGADGHFAGPAQVIECTDDEEAAQKARQFVDGHDIEVWEKDRLVALLRSEPDASD
jgi:hypothetical protein